MAPAIMVAIACAVVVAMGPAVDGEFLNWDDDRNFVENIAFRGWGPSQWAWAWRTDHLGVWQPLSWMLFGAQWCWAGLTARTYHVVSLALHALNCMILYVVIARILTLSQLPSAQRSAGWNRVFALAATLLFAVHPLRVEAVAWISAQPYLPAAFFYLLAILSYLEYRSPTRTHGRGRWLFGTILFFAIAVLFKAVAITLPIVLFILDFYPLRRRGAGLLMDKVPFIILAVPVCIWAIAAKDAGASRAPLSEFSADARLAHAAYGLIFYLVKTIVPGDLSPYYSLPKNLSLAHGRFALMAGLVVAVTVLALLMRRRWPGLLVAWVAYVVILLPNLGLIQISQQLAADRYSYLAMMPWTALLAGLLSVTARREGLRRAGMAPAVLFLALLAGGGLTWASRSQSRIWKNSTNLWSRALEVEPDGAVAHCNLGEALMRQGRYGDASFYLSRAIDRDPEFAFAYSNFAVLLCNAERFEDAVVAAERALGANPPLTGRDLARVHAVLGQAYAGLRKDELAMQHTLKARELGFIEADKMIEYLRRFRGEIPPSSQPAAPIKD
ncbi:MAG TPA: tetratricopeptide repeat protein [Phycisphaerae bacterium]|nr:tetratricopeptide repeat protein [Phycisphaerae bacterium]